MARFEIVTERTPAAPYSLDRLAMDGQRVDESFVHEWVADGGNSVLRRLHLGNLLAGQAVLSLSVKELLREFVRIRVDLKPKIAGIFGVFELQNVDDQDRGVAPQLTLWADIALADWARPYSFSDFTEVLMELVHERLPGWRVWYQVDYHAPGHLRVLKDLVEIDSSALQVLGETLPLLKNVVDEAKTHLESRARFIATGTPKGGRFRHDVFFHPRPSIMIRGRIYRVNPAVDRYQIPLDELGDIRMDQIPPHSHVEILGLPEPPGASGMECYALNGGDEGETEFLSVYGGASFKVPMNERTRMISRLGRAFVEVETNQESMLPNPWITTKHVGGEAIINVFLDLKFQDNPSTLIRDAVEPFVNGYQRLERPEAHVFICHASEDKPVARELAAAMNKLGASVWLDEWEIRVGDSIVQKINSALGIISHLIILLSESSVTKPWVQKELSAVLMRQLSEQSVTVLPLRLDDCAIPPILADIKYADARSGLSQAVDQLGEALFSESAE